MKTLNFPATQRSRGPGRIVIAIGVSAALVLMVVALSSCSSASTHHEQQIVRTGKPAMHAVGSDRLRQIMNSLRYFPQLEYTDAPKERERKLEEIRLSAGQMAESANSLPETVDELNLNEHEKEAFLKLARKMEQDSKELSRISHSSFALVESQIDAVYSTCNACHALFRSDPAMPK